MRAAAGRLDVPGDGEAVCGLQLRVAVEGGQARAVGDGIVLPRERGVRRRRPVEALTRRDAVGEVAQRGLVLAAGHRVDEPARAEVAEQAGVEAVERDHGVRAQRTQLWHELQCEPRRRVHRDGQRDQVGCTHAPLVERVDGDVEHVDDVAARTQRGRGRREAERLVPHLVGREQEDACRASRRGFGGVSAFAGVGHYFFAGWK